MRTLTRDEAIASILAERRSDGCVVCGMRDASEPDAVLVRAPRARIVIPRYALRRGHLLVLADEHVTRFEALPLETWEQMARLAHAAARALERALQPTRCYVASLGTAIEDLPMTSPHLHVHVVPLHDPAARPSSVLSWEQGVLALDEEDRAELARELLAVWDA